MAKEKNKNRFKTVEGTYGKPRTTAVSANYSTGLSSLTFTKGRVGAKIIISKITTPVFGIAPGNNMTVISDNADVILSRSIDFTANQTLSFESGAETTEVNYYITPSLVNTPIDFTVENSNGFGTTTITPTGNSTITNSNLVLADFLVIGGGSAGGGTSVAANFFSPGGGAGGYREFNGYAFPLNQTFTVTVGAGGTSGGVGANSIVWDIIANGGGNQNTSGGSGGGGGENGSGRSALTITSLSLIELATTQGNAGGNGALEAAGGGGGAGATGVNATANVGGNGGAGRASSITGTSVARAGGGGGSGRSTRGLGVDGGGNATVNGDGISASGNTGGGGGGAGNTGATARAGGAGGSGVIIFKIPDTYTATFSAGVTSSLSTSVAGFNIYSVTATSTTSETVTFTTA
jgi:hypothetical protein